MRDGASTVADDETVVDARRDDERFESIRGRIVLMTGPPEEQGQFTGDLFPPLASAMDAAGCPASASGMRVQRPEDRDGDMAVVSDGTAAS